MPLPGRLADRQCAQLCRQWHLPSTVITLSSDTHLNPLSGATLTSYLWTVYPSAQASSVCGTAPVVLASVTTSGACTVSAIEAVAAGMISGRGGDWG
jgi:hypothetical protein